MKRERGFTLTELLVVIAIFVILLGLSAAALLPMRKQFAVIDTPAYRGAKMVERALRQARLLAMQTGVPHSVAFNRPAAHTTQNSTIDAPRSFVSNYGADNAPPEGDNFFVIVRHQRGEDNDPEEWTGAVVDPWAELNDDSGTVLKTSWRNAAEGRQGEALWTAITDASFDREAEDEAKADELIRFFGVTPRETGRLPAGAGFYALGAGIPVREMFGTTRVRVWRWCWDDLKNQKYSFERGAMSEDGGGMLRASEAVRVWIDAAGETDRHAASPNPPSGGPLDDFPQYAESPDIDGVGTVYPYRLAARVTFLPTGEMIPYIGGRPAVLPAGPFTPPFNYTLTPNGFHIVAVGDTGAGVPPTGDATGGGLRDIQPLWTNDYAGEKFVTYFVGVNQFTGETWVKNRFEMLDWAHDQFPCHRQDVTAMRGDYATIDKDRDNHGDSNQTNSSSASARQYCIYQCQQGGGGGANSFTVNARYFVGLDSDPGKRGNPEYFRTTTRVKSNNSGIDLCCGDRGCQWRAAVRLDNN